MTEVSVTPVTGGGDGLGESGHWLEDGRWSSLVYVNTQGPCVKRYWPATGAVTTCSTAAPCSFALPRGRHCDSLVVAQGDRLDYLDTRHGEQTPCVTRDTLGLGDSVTTNDGKCDSHGRLWLGTYQKGDMSKLQPVGSLYSVTGAGVVRQQATGFTLCNGLDWSCDERTFIMADSVAKSVTAWDFDVASGQISRQRKAFDFSGRPGMPDGLTVDAQDHVWVAFLTQGLIQEFDMATGKPLRVVPLPASSSTCPCWGGPGYDVMYVTSATMFTTEEQRQQQPHAGALFKVTGLGVKGKAPHKFDG